MPTPRVSVPQMTVSRPACASCSTTRRYFGSIPAWWTPIPARSSFDSVLPNPAPKRTVAIRAAIASLSRVAPVPEKRALVPRSSDVACSTAAAWVKWTTYAGACPVSTSSSRVSSRVSVDHVKLSGTGRSAWSTTAVSRPLRRATSSAIAVMSPRVADISRNCACGSSSSGTCHAQPRSGSA